MAANAPLQFNGFNVFKIVFDRGSNLSEGEFAINVQLLPEFPNPDDKLSFQIVFIITLTSVKNTCTLQVQALGDFKILGEVEQSVHDNYVNISAPSIVYPYIRAFISNLFLQSGMPPVIIPPLNFGAKQETQPAQPNPDAAPNTDSEENKANS